MKESHLASSKLSLQFIHDLLCKKMPKKKTPHLGQCVISARAKKTPTVKKLIMKSIKAGKPLMWNKSRMTNITKTIKNAE